MATRSVISALSSIMKTLARRTYILNNTLRRLFWRNLITRQPSGDQVGLVWRSPAINEAVRGIVRKIIHSSQPPDVA
jgi:hypothetical protein